MLKMLAEYFKDKVIGFEDPFKTPASKKQIALLKNCMKEGIGNSLAFAKEGKHRMWWLDCVSRKMILNIQRASMVAP